jgi:DNA-binding transcriptional LysR family regulator
MEQDGRSGMNFTDLEAFVCVLDHGSIVAASAALHLTQSAVTRRIQNLEDALGVPLLDRHTRPLQPTRAGSETYVFAKPVLASVRDLKAAVMHNGEPAGDLRFGMSRGLGDTALLTPIRSLRAQFPKVRPQVFVQWSATLLEELTSGSLDAAVINLPEGATPPSSLVSELIATEPIEIIAGKSTKLSQPPTVEELSSHPWVLNPEACGIREAIAIAFRQRGLPLVTAVESESYDLKFTLIADGMGLGAVMPQLYYSSPLRKSLKVVKVKDFAPKFNVWLVHSRHLGRLAPAVMCLRNSVQKSLKHIEKSDRPTSTAKSSGSRSQ